MTASGSGSPETGTLSRPPGPHLAERVTGRRCFPTGNVTPALLPTPQQNDQRTCPNLFLFCIHRKQDSIKRVQKREMSLTLRRKSMHRSAPSSPTTTDPAGLGRAGSGSLGAAGGPHRPHGPHGGDRTAGNRHTRGRRGVSGRLAGPEGKTQRTQTQDYSMAERHLRRPVSYAHLLSKRTKRTPSWTRAPSQPRRTPSRAALGRSVLKDARETRT